MSGKLPINSNQYFSIDQTITNDQGTQSFPFRLTRLLDIIRNDGPDEAAVSLDGGAEIPLLAGDYIGPWDGFQCSTISMLCKTQGGNCRIRALGV